MATVTDPGLPTLLNWVNRLKPDGSVETNLANTLTKKMPMLNDIPWVEGNLATGHRIVGVTTLATPTFRKVNQGLDPAKNTTAPYDETCCLMELHSKIDVELANLNGGGPAYRMSEDSAIIEGFNQQFSSSLFYEDVTLKPERFHGLSPRYPATSGYTTSGYVTKGTNSGSNCHSVWLVNWDPQRVACIFPKGTVAGLQQEDLGKILALDANNKQFLAWMTRFTWKAGVMVKDYRYVARHQWDPDDANYASTAKNLYLAMLDMQSTVFEMLPTATYYMSRKSFKLLQDQLASNSLNYLDYISRGGERIRSFGGVPIRFTDSLIDESAIS